VALAVVGSRSTVMSVWVGFSGSLPWKRRPVSTVELASREKEASPASASAGTAKPT
jgi:hypothetical protein